MVFVTLNNSSFVALMSQISKNCSISTPITSKIRTQKHERTKIFLKPDRYQTEVFSTSNYNGYVTECQGSLSNQNFIDLIQIIYVFVTKHCDVQCFFMLGANEQDISAGKQT